MKHFKIVIFSVILVQLFFFTPFSHIESSSRVNGTFQKNTNSSVLQTPFTISGNTQLSSFASFGNGTQSAPYLLQNYVIKGTKSSDIGITIQDTTDYFVLENTNVSNCGIGVSFVNVTKGSIIYSYLVNNSNVAIEITHSSSISVRSNNLLNNAAGILFKNNSSDITVDGNIITNNEIGISSGYISSPGVVNSSFNYNYLNTNIWGFWWSNKNLPLNDSFISNTVKNSTNNAFCFQNSINDTFVNNIATTSQHDGFYLQNGSNNTFLENMANYNGFNGFYLQSVSNNTFLDNTGNANGFNGFNFDQSNNNSLNGNLAGSNNENGFNFTSQSNSNVLYNNSAQNNHVNGIILSHCYYNNITFNKAFLNNWNGFDFYVNQGNFISDNIAQLNSNDGFLINVSGTYLHQNTLTNNTALTNAYSGFELINAFFVNIAETYSADNLIGFNIYNSYDVSLINDTAFNNREDGFHIDTLQNSTISNNSATQNGWANYFHNNNQFVTLEYNNFPVNLPSEPQNVKLTYESTNDVFISWSPPVTNGGGNITVYKVYRSSDGMHYSYIGNTTKLSYIDPAPVRGKDMSYEITAVNSAGEGPKSSVLMFVVIPEATTHYPLSSISNDHTQSSNALQNLFNFVFVLIVLGLLIFIIGIGTSSYNSYRKYNLKVDQGKKILFTKIVRKKILKKKRKKAPTVKPHEVDKSLEIIEEILDESQTGK